MPVQIAYLVMKTDMNEVSVLQSCYSQDGSEVKVMMITASYVRLCCSISATSKQKRKKTGSRFFLGLLSKNQTQFHLQKISARTQVLFLWFTVFN